MPGGSAAGGKGCPPGGRKGRRRPPLSRSSFEPARPSGGVQQTPLYLTGPERSFGGSRPIWRSAGTVRHFRSSSQCRRRGLAKVRPRSGRFPHEPASGGVDGTTARLGSASTSRPVDGGNKIEDDERSTGSPRDSSGPRGYRARGGDRVRGECFGRSSARRKGTPSHGDACSSLQSPCLQVRSGPRAGSGDHCDDSRGSIGPGPRDGGAGCSKVDRGLEAGRCRSRRARGRAREGEVEPHDVAQPPSECRSRPSLK
jgi:hypothetical protein